MRRAPIPAIFCTNSCCDRQFLSASHPSDKYKVTILFDFMKLSHVSPCQFFLRGTQLSQLSDEYDTCLENITQTTKVLAQKREAIPDLETAFDEARVRFEEASKAREQRHKADELKKELAWAHVASKQEELTKKIQEVTKIKTSRLPKLQKEVDNATVRLLCLSLECPTLMLYAMPSRSNSRWPLRRSPNMRLSIRSLAKSII